MRHPSRSLGPYLLLLVIAFSCARPARPAAVPHAEDRQVGQEAAAEAPPDATLKDDARPAAPRAMATRPPDPPLLTIFVVDIGQGDATVILGPEIDGRRRALVMDAGDRAPDGGKIVGRLLADEGVRELDWVVLSHFDADHLGGFVTISGSTSLLWQSPQCDQTPLFPKVAIYDQGTDTNQTQSSREWRRCVPIVANANGTRHLHVEGGREIGTTLDFGEGVTATLVAGDGYVWERSGRVDSVNTPNERSISLLVSNGAGFDFLVTGDLIGRPFGAENAEVEGALGKTLAGRGIDVEVLRTGHHGAANACEPAFLSAIRPEVAIISTGDNQRPNYKHPSCASYKSLLDASIQLVLQTELGKTDCAGPPPVTPVVVNGTIRIDVSGGTYASSSYGTTSANGVATTSMQYACTVANGCAAAQDRAQCCRICARSTPCGDSCIATGLTCSRPAGCACAAE